MESNQNPYQVNAAVDRQLDLRSSLDTAMWFGVVGIICGAIGGFLLESDARGAVTTASVLIGPGLVFGAGMAFALWRFVPNTRAMGRWLFPPIALLGFGLIGLLFDYASFKWSAQQPLWKLWAILSVHAIPGVVLLMLGSLVVAKPKFWVRLIGVGVVVTLITGACPLLTNISPGVYRPGPRFFVAMFLAQLSMFLLFGWVFGDTIQEED
ncbi:MAG: hypothetical protein AB8G99_05025 [Planctomycetaceae bacterium]